MSKNSSVSVGEWIITFILLAIPLVGFIMLFVWAFGSDTNECKRNYAKATLILVVILVVLSILIFLVMGAAIFQSLS